MGSFSVRTFAQPNFENVTGIGLNTSFEEMTLSHLYMCILSYLLSKGLSPQPLLHGTSSLNKTVALAEHYFVLYFQNVYFPTLLGKLY